MKNALGSLLFVVALLSSCGSPSKSEEKHGVYNSDESVEKLIADFSERAILMDLWGGDTKQDAKIVGGVQFFYKKDARQKYFLSRIHGKTTDLETGGIYSRTTTIIFSSTSPYKLVSAMELESLYAAGPGKKRLHLKSSRVDIKENTLLRSTFTDTQETLRKEFPVNSEEVPTMKQFFAIELLVRSGAPVGSSLKVSGLNTQKLASFDDEEFAHALKGETLESEVVTRDKDSVLIREIITSGDGLDKRESLYSSNGDYQSLLLAEIPYFEARADKNNKKKITIEGIWKLDSQIPELAKDEGAQAQFAKGALSVLILEKSKRIPAGPDQSISGDQLTLKKWVNGQTLDLVTEATDLAHPDDNLIPKDLLALIKAQFKKGMSDAEKLKIIQTEVHKRVEYLEASDDFTITETFRLKRGDCNNFASIYAAILRHSQIPAHIGLGAMYYDGGSGLHAWTEAKIDGKWEIIEATAKTFSEDTFNTPNVLYLRLGSLPTATRSKDTHQIFSGYFLEFKK